MPIACGPLILSVLTGAPVPLIEQVIRSGGADPEVTTAGELSAALAHFGLGLELVAWWRGFEGPRLKDWLRVCSGELLSERLAVLIEERGREDGHWVAVGGLLAPESFTDGAWVEADEGLSEAWLVRQVWRVGAATA